MSISELETKLCNVLLSEFKDAYELPLTSDCPACGIIGARHRRNEVPVQSSSTSKSTASNVTNAFIKIQKLLPKFDKSDCREFLKQVERRLKFSDNIPQEKWTLVFMYIEMEYAGATWRT